MTVNGLGEVSALGVDPTAAGCTNNVNASLLGLGKQLSNYLILGTHFQQPHLNSSSMFSTHASVFLSFIIILIYSSDQVLPISSSLIGFLNRCSCNFTVNLILSYVRFIVFCRESRRSYINHNERPPASSWERVFYGSHRRQFLHNGK
jgi:hypothetical protein